MAKSKKKPGRHKGSTLKVDGLITTNRRVQKSGKSFTITIPKQFIDAHNIKKGEPLAMVGNHILKIIPTKEIGDKEIGSK